MEMYDVVFIGNSLQPSDLKSTCVEPDMLLACKGELGNFTLRIQKEKETQEIKTRTVIINLLDIRESPLAEVPTWDELQEPEEPVIFLQDLKDLTPAQINGKGLELARDLAQKGKSVYYFYRSLRFNRRNDELYEKARRAGVVFYQYRNGDLEVKGSDGLICESPAMELELHGTIFLAPDLKPNMQLERLARIFNIRISPEGYLQVENVHLQPTYTGKRGVYALEGARNPAGRTDPDQEEAFTLAEIRSLLSNINPLTEEERVVDAEKCAFCYTCYRVCSHGALEPDWEEDAMKVLQIACQGCDTCLNVCPAGAISIEGREEKKKEANLKVFMCENSAATALQRLGKNGFSELDIENVPCLGSLKKKDLLQHLQKSEDRVLVLGCFEEACKHLFGERWGDRSVKDIQKGLKALNLKEDRLTLLRLSPRMEKDLEKILSLWKEGNL